MTYEEIIRRQAELREQLTPLTEKPAEDLTDEDVETLRAGTVEHDELETRRVRCEESRDHIERVKSWKDTPAVETAVDRDYLAAPEAAETPTRSNPWDLAEVRRAYAEGNLSELHSRALSAAEETPGVTDTRREALTQRLAEIDGDGRLSRLVLASTSPEYKRAFAKIVRDGGQWHNLTGEEADAARAGQEIARAMSVTTDGSGGYLVLPTDLEAGLRLDVAGNANPIVDLSSKVTTMGDTYRTVASDAASWSWDAENAEVSDDTTTFTNIDIPLYSANGFVPVSMELTVQAADLTSTVSAVLEQGHDDLVSAAVTTGTGSSQPTGIITALTGGSYEYSSATTDTFAIADVYTVHESLAPQFRGKASWIANINIINDIRQFGTADSHAFLSHLDAGQPSTILGRPVYECSNMDGTINAAAENYVLVLGDFSNFTIVTALGSLVEVVPHVFGSNGRPTGSRGFFAKHKFGCDSVLDRGFAMLNVT